ncbi:unnamed protein product [Anisakis simplex]|uniref:AcidPPc domain-containing protein n=1 Tax=Anisakis simplex TaxID=6269 RepID=A0A0M3IZW5_ANISI|nr:unnamed protein product [Anisakis simplex]
MFWLFSTRPRKTVYANCGECKIHLFTRRVIRFIAGVSVTGRQGRRKLPFLGNLGYQGYCRGYSMYKNEHIAGIFMFGALITQIFVHTIKLMTGYQRPYFLSLCNVNMSMCTAPLEHSPSPSPALACNYRNADDLRYAWLSFPSLHAAFSSYSCVFASLYIYYMITLRGAPLLRPFLIFGFMGLTLVDSFSRINGYKNHWRDIWVGWLIGFFIAFFLCHSVLCFQEVYHEIVERVNVIEERLSPFFQWFRLPRVHAPSLKEEYV